MKNLSVKERQANLNQLNLDQRMLKFSRQFIFRNSQWDVNQHPFFETIDFNIVAEKKWPPPELNKAGKLIIRYGWLYFKL